MPIIIIFTAVVALFTLTAAITDARWCKIPNKLTLPVAAAGIVFHTGVFLWAWITKFDPTTALPRDAITGDLTPLGIMQAEIMSIGPTWAVLGFLVGFLLLLTPLLMGGGGGGDVKLLAALGAWLGIRWILLVFMLGVMIAAFIMIIKLVIAGPTKSMRQTRKILEESKQSSGKDKKAGPPKKRKRLLAFGVPMAISTWIILALILMGKLNEIWTLF